MSEPDDPAVSHILAELRHVVLMSDAQEREREIAEFQEQLGLEEDEPCRVGHVRG